MDMSTRHEDANDPTALQIRDEAQASFQANPELPFEPGPNHVSARSTVEEDAGCPIALKVRAQAGDQGAKNLLAP